MLRVLFVSLLFCPTFAALPAEIRGRVLSVEAGDEFVLDRGGTQVAVALYGVEAPEKGQPFADQAREYFTRLIQGREVRLEETGRRADGRVLARVYIGGVSAQAELITRGLVWVVPVDAPESYRVLEGKARAGRAGVWSQARPVAPWEFRKNQSKIQSTPDCESPPAPPAPVAPPPPKPGPPAGTGGCSIE